MAERSFKKEVEQLKLGAGKEFRGEAILCVTKALLQSGVSYVSGYQGAPISHLIDVLNDAEPMLKELGVRFQLATIFDAPTIAGLTTNVLAVRPDLDIELAAAALALKGDEGARGLLRYARTVECGDVADDRDVDTVGDLKEMPT